MSYTRLVRFGTVDLPTLDPEWEPGPAEGRDRTVATTGGFFDADGAGRAEAAFPLARRFRGTVAEDTAAAMRTTLTALRGLVRKRLKLWREQEDDSDREWCWARLIEAPMAQSVYLAQEVELRFLLLCEWRGVRYSAGWVFDDGEVFDDGLYFDEDDAGKYTLNTSPKAITLGNGDAPVREVTITLTAGSAAITDVTVADATSGCAWSYDGTVASGKSLVMSAGNKALANDGTDAYDSHFTLEAAHASPWWFELAPGDNSVTVTLTGGSTDSTITFEYAEAWE